MSRSHRKKSAKGKSMEDEPSGLSVIPEEVPLPQEEVEPSEQPEEPEEVLEPKGKNPLAEEIEIRDDLSPEDEASLVDFIEGCQKKKVLAKRPNTHKPEVTFDLPRFRDKSPSHEPVKEHNEEPREESKEEPKEEPEKQTVDTEAIPQNLHTMRVPPQLIQAIYDKAYYEGANQGAALYALGLGILQFGVGLAILFL